MKTLATDKLPRQRIDWDAVERDYRTGRFTLRELGAKHHLDHATIARKIKRERTADPARWQRDLSEAVRRATSATLMTALVSSEITKGQQEVTDVVQVAAEANTQIILGHRQRLVHVLTAADAAKAKIITLLGAVTDIRQAATAMSAIEAYARVVRIVIDKEREASGLNSAEAKESADPANALREFIGQLHSSGAGRLPMVVRFVNAENGKPLVTEAPQCLTV